jgi:hypothetical protein
MLYRSLAVVGTLSCFAAAAQAHESTRASYVEIKNAQVMRAFLVFAATPCAPERDRDGLGAARARDELLLPAGRGPSTAAADYGAAMLGAAVVLTAHAPAPLRPLFDARVHLGPAVFAGGGMGAGVGGHF